MEIELIQDGKGVDYNKYRDVIENVKESLFRRNMGKETKEWIYISNFVGILFDKNRLIYLYQNQLLLKRMLIKKRYFINMQDYLIYILWLMKKNVIL
ncbi:MAG TPA: hypothetical protein OIL95_09320 [Coprobacillaceae bacterium]|nr:hypothetical protein [Coprobacillaceae bacterium]